MSAIDISRIPVVVLAFANERSEGGFLRNLTYEMKSLLRVLEPAVQEGRIWVKVIPAASQSEIVSVFQDEWYHDRISVFHYGGHADADELWLEDEAGGNQSFFAMGLARFLGAQGSLRLTFLNACATADHARLLHEANVPATITTSQKIRDDQATEFATIFYRGLAGGASLEESFQEAEGVLLGLYGPDSFAAGGGTRTLHWEESVSEEEGQLDLPWRLDLREKAGWVPAQWRLFYDLDERDSSDAPSQAADFVGTSFNNYQLESLLGQGTMGAVYKAKHRSLAENRAIKVTHPVEEGYDHLKSLVLAGNKGMSKIQHPNIAKFYDVGEEILGGEPRLFMVMELVNGKRLDQMDYETFGFEKDAAYPMEDLIFQLFSGLNAAHQTSFYDLSGLRHEGIIHGNIKTRKVLFTPEGTPKLIDFMFTDLTRSGGIKLRWPPEVEEKVRREDPEAFLAPELVKGTAVPNVKTDLFAMGMVCLEVLCREAATQTHFGTYDTLQSHIVKHNPKVPKYILKIMWNLLHPKATLRYASAEQVLDDLKKGIPWFRRQLSKFR